jgi:hypothetical protein
MNRVADIGYGTASLLSKNNKYLPFFWGRGGIGVTLQRKEVCTAVRKIINSQVARRKTKRI